MKSLSLPMSPCNFILYSLSFKISKHSFPCGQRGVKSSDLASLVGNERTHILSLSTLQWRDGPALIADGSFNHWGYSQLGEETLILVGGRSLTGTYDALSAIYSFDGENYQWTLQEAKLDVARYYLGVVALPDNFVECVKRQR